MRLVSFLTLLCAVPTMAFGAARDTDAVRIGVTRMSMAGARSPNMVVKIQPTVTTKPTVTTAGVTTSTTPEPVAAVAKNTTSDTKSTDTDCRTAYRACMDEFCLLDESEGRRCACSSNIEQSKTLIQEIQKIQSDADNLYTEGVEREQLGAKAKLVFGESEKAKKSSRASGISFIDWLNSGSSVSDTDALDSDNDIGDGLYAMASEYCADKLAACGDRAEMEETLYARQIVSDCKSFNAYLTDQKTNATANKRTAEAAVRKARLEMLDTTNKYNRGECLLAYRACIADKGGCGTNFENCLDADLLGRRANACENVLDQCMAVRDYVVQDWAAESETILADAAKYADKNARATCLARIQVCLEDSCSTETNSTCLTDVNVAAGICPVITECETLIPGIQSSVNDKLGYLRIQFCQNDIDKCLQDKCGENFTAPECLGKTPTEIAALCPQSMYPSCKNEKQFDIIVQSVLLQMDYKLVQGCLNYFGEQLGAVCGTDMSCLPTDTTIASLTSVPDNSTDLAALRETVRNNVSTSVDEFFKQFEQDKTVAACQDSEKPQGQKSLGDTVFNSAKMIAQIGAENRAMRALENKIAELSRKQDLAAAEKNCLAMYQVETPDKSSKNYSYIRSVSFEPSLRNCHVCRMQQVCETGGESKRTAGMKGLLAGATEFSALGTMVTPGWGTAIGAVAGATAGLFAGRSISDQQEFCQEIESCEDINM